ncbi:prephenate dehydrogenase/arogenate dehydrogenase family protein [bacterium]|nr:prephenate dehydrogenase/arogenate dehydrogenase family protein [bacterium]
MARGAGRIRLNEEETEVMVADESGGFTAEDLPRRVVIAGVGLIGGSIGMRLKQSGRVENVIGMGRSAERLARAKQLDAIDTIATDWPSAMAEADAVILCGPVSTIAEAAQEAWKARRNDHLWISDAGSTKGGIVDAIERTPELAAAFVGGHPIAGSERSGVEASRADLFEGRSCIVTPTSVSSEQAIDSATAFWRSLGMKVVRMDPRSHDQALAATSHLPHVLASVIARSVPVEDHVAAAGAFRDMTRVAAAEGNLWADIFLANREFLDDSLERHLAEVVQFREILASGSADALTRWWSEGRRRRLAYEEKKA